MANLDRPKGFEPYGVAKHIGIYQSGSEIFRGDMVVLASDGQVDPAAGTDGVLILGCAAEYVAASGTNLRVYDDPAQEFVVQADEAEINVQTDIGNTLNLLATAGNSQFEHSRQELDSSDIGTAATAQFRILRIEPGSGNAFGAQVDVVVGINQHALQVGQAV